MFIVYMFRASIFISIVISMTVTNRVAAAPIAEKAGSVSTIGYQLSDFEDYSRNSSAADGFEFIVGYSFRQPRDGWMRVHLNEISIDPSEMFDLVLVNSDGEDMVSIASNELAEHQSDGWTSPMVVGPNITVEVRSNALTTNSAFRIAEIAYETAGGSALSVTGGKDQRELVGLIEEGESSIKVMSRAVGQINYRAEDGIYYNCTGFLIDEDRLLTNEHCINSTYRCRHMNVQFGFLSWSVNTDQFRCGAIVSKSEVYDFALLEIPGRPGNIWGSLELSNSDPNDGDLLYIIQHPDGRPQELSREDCFVVNRIVPGLEADSDFAHECDTEGGSSGSPVIDPSSGQVKGLHHWGFDDTDPNFSILNRAVRVTKILNQLNSN